MSQPPQPGAPTRLLVLEPSPDLRRQVADTLGRAGFASVLAAESTGAAQSLLEMYAPELALVSWARAARATPDALRLLNSWRRIAPDTRVVFYAPPADAHAAAGMLRHGAADYLLEPLDPSEVRLRLGRILERDHLDSRLSFLQGELAKRHQFKLPIAHSRSMRRALDQALRVAPMKTTVLITGESGVGKELVARAIHLNSPRREQSFIAINCAAIPGDLIETELFGHEKGSFTGAHARVQGKFELAHGGTLFLDEIGEMNPASQAKLLRVLEQQEFMRVGGSRSLRVDVRVIAATNADLEARVREGRFRRDLYYRLKVVTIHVPPLRERREDIPGLVDTFLDELARANGVPRRSVTPDAMEALRNHAWPGNVRELKNLLESLLVAAPGEVIRLEDLPPSVRGATESDPHPGLRAGVSLEALERELIRRTLIETGGNRTHSASLLGIGVRTLQRKIRQYRLDIPSTRRRRRRTRKEEDAPESAPVR